jgi:hypothetical protein
LTGPDAQRRNKSLSGRNLIRKSSRFIVEKPPANPYLLSVARLDPCFAPTVYSAMGDLEMKSALAVCALAASTGILPALAHHSFAAE